MDEVLSSVSTHLELWEVLFYNREFRVFRVSTKWPHDFNRIVPLYSNFFQSRKKVRVSVFNCLMQDTRFRISNDAEICAVVCRFRGSTRLCRRIIASWLEYMKYVAWSSILMRNFEPVFQVHSLCGVWASKWAWGLCRLNFTMSSALRVLMQQCLMVLWNFK